VCTAPVGTLRPQSIKNSVGIHGSGHNVVDAELFPMIKMSRNPGSAMSGLSYLNNPTSADVFPEA